ncbi:MAG TPA: shikimate kinase, partial [Proteiniclasticum sp.]|nr:shikimate kinase [Proteiniclasticum sp.]
MKNIYLIGMPGSGKSTLGREIAEILQVEHIDTDEML